MQSALMAGVCRYEHFETPWFAKWGGLLGYVIPDETTDPSTLHRKHWEFAAILQSLDQRRLLAPGKKGLGFAVGKEPLPAVMAHEGVDVLATDLMAERVADNWKDTGQHATGLNDLYQPWLNTREEFDARVRFEPADMTDLSTLSGEFDFLWSSCAFEHLGTLERGLDFVVNGMRLLKPGGVAVHTTEFNVSSNDETISEAADVIYRRRDMENLDYRLRRIGCGLEPIDYFPGTHRHDLLFDSAPYCQSGRAHLKLELGGFICTSMLVVAVKG